MHMIRPRYILLLPLLIGIWTIILYMSGTGADHREQVAMEAMDRFRTENKNMLLKAIELANITIASAESHYQGQIEGLQNKLTSVTEQLALLTSKYSTLTSSTGLSSTGPSLEHEIARRRVERISREFGFYIRNEQKRLQSRNNHQDKSSSNLRLSSRVNAFMSDSAHYQTMLKNDLFKLNMDDNSEEWRLSESKKLGDLVQRRLNYLQNPKDCNLAKKLVCRLDKVCGYGCQLHSVTYCLIRAYATGHTMILQSKGWRYSKDGWETVFQPVSETCSNSTSIAGVLNLRDIDSLLLSRRPNYLPLAIPEDLADRMLRFHGDPPVWWIGQFVMYLTRPQKHLRDELEESKKRLGFENPIIGVHIRRTDKRSEAAFHQLEEYMTYVEEWIDAYEKWNPDGVQPKIFLASDDPNILPEARQKYPNYSFISDNNVSKSAAENIRYTEASLRGILQDTYFLSLCDYIVCTFSSQVCRVAYELMQTRHGDASQKFKSLDDIYYFGGQNSHFMQVIEAHEARPNYGGQEIDLQIGDFIFIEGNHWDGFSKGTNNRTGINGIFPSYKVVDKFERVQMPTYPEVTEL